MITETDKTDIGTVIFILCVLIVAFIYEHYKDPYDH